MEAKRMGTGNQTDNNDEREQEETKQIIQSIIENYKSLEESIVSQLSLSNKCHPTTTGTSRELIWLKLFKNIIPKKFVIEHSVFIIDSHFGRSKEVDLAIIDNAYTPYIFQYGKLKFVPIEAVAAVIECKSKKLDSGSLEKWCESIKGLRTSRRSIARMANGMVVNGIMSPNHQEESKEDSEANDKQNPDQPSVQPSTQTSTRPIRIFCGYDSDIGKGEQKVKKFFDFWIIAKDEQEKRIEVETNQKEDDSLNEWYIQLDHYGTENGKEIKESPVLKDYKLDNFRVMKGGEEVSLLSLNLQLNQLLMLINNPILFPHLSYAKMFNDVDQKEEKE